LVNNAGVIEPIGPLAETDPVAWARNINVNLIGAYNALRATLPLDAGEPRRDRDQHFIGRRA
jgi:NAD(P)-dependent dehydrogenase (short-subunit alcohol dehydrogenase family)